MTKNELLFHVGFLKASTSTVDCGNHFDDLRILITRLDKEEFDNTNSMSILREMLELEYRRWDKKSKQKHTSLLEQLTASIG